MSCLDISQPRRGVDQRVGPIGDGPESAVLDQFGHGEQVLPALRRRDEGDLLTDEQIDDCSAEDAADRADDVTR